MNCALIYSTNPLDYNNSGYRLSRTVQLYPLLLFMAAIVSERRMIMSDKSSKPRKHERELRELGLMVAYYRKLKNIGQEELADRAGISRTHLGNLEAPGKASSISISVLFDLADALGVPAKALLDFKGDAFRDTDN